MLFPDPDSMTMEEINDSNRATYLQLVDVKLQEINNLMDLPVCMYEYPFQGTTHSERQDELRELMIPVAEAMGVTQFMSTPMMISLGCLFSSHHRNESERLPIMLNDILGLFMSLYGAPDTSDVAVQGFAVLEQPFCSGNEHGESGAVHLPPGESIH